MSAISVFSRILLLASVLALSLPGCAMWRKDASELPEDNVRAVRASEGLTPAGGPQAADSLAR